MAKEKIGVDLVYSNPGEITVDKFYSYTAEQVNKQIGQALAVKSPEVKRGLRSILGTVVFPKKEGWTPASVSYHVRKFKERGYPGEILETTQSYRYTLKVLPEIAKKTKLFRYRTTTITKGKDAGKKISLLFGIIPKEGGGKVGKKITSKVDQKVIPGSILIYDNEGKSLDRYTVFIGKNVFGMSKNPLSPQGFNQYTGTTATIKPGAHLGKRIKFESLPNDVKTAIKKRMNAKVSPKLEPIKSANFRDPKAQQKIMRKGLIAKMRTKKITHITPKVAKKYNLYPEAKKYKIRVEQALDLETKAINELKEVKGQVAGQVSAGKQEGSKVSKKESIKRMWTGKIKAGKVKSLKKSFADKYSLTDIAKKHGVQVGQEVVTRRERKMTQKIADFIRAKAKEGIKPNVIKGLVKQRFNTVVSTSTIYKVTKGLYKTSAVEKQIGKEVNKMDKQLEQTVIAEIMANPGLSGIFERCPSVGRFATALAKSGMSARQVTNQINAAITKAGKVGNISVSRLRNWGKNVVKKPWLFSRYTGSEAQKKTKWEDAKARGTPHIRGRGGKALGVKGAAGLAEMRAAVRLAGKKAAEMAIAAYKGRIPKEAIAARKAGATAAQVNAIVNEAIANQAISGIDENPALGLRTTGTDMLAKLVGVTLGANVTGLVKKGANAVLKVEPLATGWKPAMASVGSGVAGYFIGDILGRVIRPRGAYAGLVSEIFESFRTAAVMYIGQAIPIPGKVTLVKTESGVEGYIDSLAERALGRQTGAQLEQIMAQTGGELIPMAEDKSQTVNQQLPDGSTLILMKEAAEPISAQLEDVRESVEAELEEIE